MATTSRLSRRAMSMLGLAVAAGLPPAGGAEAAALSTPTGRPGARGFPAANLPTGVDIERIARTPTFAVGSAGRATIDVARCRMASGASIELVFGGSTLIVVESGALTIDGAGPGVATIHTGGIASSTPDAKTRTPRWVPGTDGRVVVPETGSAFAEDGLFGSVRNEAADDLTLLIVAVGAEPDAGDVTVVPAPGAPQP